MKRSLISLSILLMLLATVAQGLEVAEPQLERVKLNRALEPMQSDYQARADTIFLFAASGPGSYGSEGTDSRGFTFDDGSGGSADAGWSSIDLTVQEGTWWHMASASMVDGHGTDMSAAGQPWTPGDSENDFALWCGREAVCGWIHPSGYGNDWEQYAELEQPGFSTDLVVNFALNSDFEGPTYDFFLLEIEVDGVAVEVFRHDTAADQIYHEFNVTIAAEDYDVGAVFGDVLFHFTSDGGWSDQDGSFISDVGAVWVDNIELVADGSIVFQEDFESGVLPSEISFSVPSGAGDYANLYMNLYAEDVCVVNSSHAWAFFDLNTTNPEYPIPVTPYGPPHMDNAIRSPILNTAHTPGNPSGSPLVITAESQVNLEYWVYLDMPINSLIFEKWGIAAVIEGQACPGDFRDDQTSYYGDDKIWFAADRNVTLELSESANGGNITGVIAQLRAVDRCPVWCNVNGDGTGHTPAPYYDKVRVKVISASAVAWNVDQYRRFQDNFPDQGTGFVRMDSSDDIAPLGSNTLMIGDSSVVELNMDLVGGIKQNNSNPAGQMRPELYMWYRVVAGPNAGTANPASADPDASDGIWSPHIGTMDFNGVTFNGMLADSAITGGSTVNGTFAFDFNDDFFEAGDVVELFYRGESNTGIIETRPRRATSSDPALRAFYTVRCLPTAGTTMLFCEDNLGVLPWWDEAFRYNGYSLYDIYTTQAPSSGLHNGLSGRAEVGDIDQYHVITWDSGNLPTYTITNALPEDKTFDTDLLDDWLINSSHDTHLWAMGCEIGNDLGNSDGFLGTNLGALLLFDGQYIDDVTGETVPMVNATHPSLEVGGLAPYFWVDGGCPTVENFSVVEANGAHAQISHQWDDDGGTTAVAGIFNLDPDGDGTTESSAGYDNRTLYNPFSYYQVWDAGFGVAQGFDYSRQMVGDVLVSLFNFGPNTTPDSSGELPAATALVGNFPNPFNPKTTIRFALSSAEAVQLNVYDLTGRVVKTLVNGPMSADHHEVVWDGKNGSGDRVASGVYFYKLVAGDYSATEKMLLLK